MGDAEALKPCYLTCGMLLPAFDKQVVSEDSQANEGKNMSFKKLPYVAALLSFSVAILLCDNSSTSAQAKISKATTIVNAAVEEASIREQLTSLSKTLAAGDEKAVANLWTEDGSYIDADGTVFRGRGSLERRFANQFKENGKRTFELAPERVRVLSRNVAQVEGTVKRKDGQIANPETRYSMVFVKQAGVWLIDSAVETPIESAGIQTGESLSDLSWLIGEWKAERNGASARLKAEWTTNKNFIRCTYEIKKPNEPLAVDYQIIGWDPIKEQVVSWLFESDGGAGRGLWEKKENKWVVESTGIERGGEITSAINIIEPTEPNSFVWQSLNRDINGIALGDTLPLKVERVIQ
jgi:uncharacterized protein (TIGR02246 family)